MMKLSKALMLSVSGLIFTSNGSAASIYDSTSFNSPDAITFVHTHTPLIRKKYCCLHPIYHSRVNPSFFSDTGMIYLKE